VGQHRLLVRRANGPEPGAPAVVLVHGVVSGRYLEPTARAFADQCSVLAPDLPGFGRSSRPERTLGIAEHADVLAELISFPALRGPTLVGHSIGAQSAASVVVRHPDLVGRLVVVGPTGDPRAHSVAAVVRRWLATAPAEPLRFNALACREVADVGPRRMIGVLRAALADPFVETLARVAVPALVVRGERDRVAPQRWAEEAGATLGARVIVVPDVAHTLVYSAAFQLVDAVVSFLGRRTGDRAVTPESRSG
jgi:2-hydroxy-6-oxonona-2,4-dienedioate hydrolase